MNGWMDGWMDGFVLLQLAYFEPGGFLGIGTSELKQRGSIQLNGGKLLAVTAVDRVVNPDNNVQGTVFAFNVETPSRVWNLYAPSAEVAMVWILHIRRFLLRGRVIVQ